jgi:hypothetical protein
MAKIKITHFSVGPTYMFVIDTRGKIWRRTAENAGSTWTPAGELPDEPENPMIDAHAEASQLPDEPHDPERTLSGIVPEA